MSKWKTMTMTRKKVKRTSKRGAITRASTMTMSPMMKKLEMTVTAIHMEVMTARTERRKRSPTRRRERNPAVKSEKYLPMPI